MKHNITKKAFTLIELIVVIAVLAVLAVLIIPQVTGYIQASQKSTCDANVAMMNRSYIYEHELDTKVTPQDIINNTDGKYFGGNTKTCPSKGTYSVNTSNIIVCSKHGGTGDESGFIKNGTIEDERENLIEKESNAVYGEVVKSTDQSGNPIYFKCINKSGCSTTPNKHLGENNYSNTAWKELVKDYTDYNNYETGDIIIYNNRYYKYTAVNETPGMQKYIGKTPDQAGAGFVEVPQPTN